MGNFMSRSGLILFITQLLLLSLVNAEEGIITVNIEPVVSLLFQDHDSEHGRRLNENSNLDLKIVHPFVRAVYASLVELDERNSTGFIKENNIYLKKFNENRHLSKYERHYQHQHRRLQSLRKTHTTEGGLYEEFQSAPLAQGYGTHYATLWVGKPTPQKKTLIVDTGSHHTAFPCKGCKMCGEKYHTDKYFDMDQSISFHALSCNECRWGAECQTIPVLSELANLRNKNNGKEGFTHVESISGCYLETSYTEGSRWEAFQVADRVFLGGKDVFSGADEAQRFSFNFIFGCQTYSNGLFVSQLADGIMGLSQHEATLPRIMYNQGKLSSRIFSICFRTEIATSKKGISAGLLTLGGIDNRLQSTPMVYARNISYSGWFTVYLKKIYLRIGGGQSAKIETVDNIVEVPLDIHSINSGKGVILDSGTTDTYLHQSLAKPFNDIWKEVTGSAYSNSPTRLTQSQLVSLPTVLVQLLPYDSKFDTDLGSPDDIIGLVGTKLDPVAPTDILIAIPAAHYMEYTPSKDTYTPRIYFTESRGGVLGANALQGHDISFDWEHARIGISESSCKLIDRSQDVNSIVSENFDDNRGHACTFQNAVITESCIENVDLSLCSTENPNSNLDGVETLTMIIDHPGSSTNLVCEEVMRRENGFLDGQCTESGICSFRKQCQISCKSVIESEGLIPSTSNNFSGMCSHSWGSCLKSCKQAKLDAVLMSDGNCHEIKGRREERDCHTDFCGMNDPCMVPFVVHAIFGFRGVDHTKIDPLSTEIFSDSISSNGENLFLPGDVKILMISPWHQNVLNVSDTMLPEMSQIGTKIVFEIHIYNTHAIRFDDQEVRHTGIFRDEPSDGNLAECERSDIFDLAEKAHNVRSLLARVTFVENVVRVIGQDSRLQNHRITAFSDLLTNPGFVYQSTVLSSWIIKTEVGGGSVYDHETEPFPFSEYHTSRIMITNISVGEYIPFLIIPILCYIFMRKRKFGAYNNYFPTSRKKHGENGKFMDDFVTLGNQSYEVENTSSPILYNERTKRRFRRND